MSDYKFEIKHKVATILSSFARSRVDTGCCSLMYHSIVDTTKTFDLYQLRKKDFIDQINFIKQSKYKVVDFGSSDVGLSITFDDGHLDNYFVAADILLQNQIPFTVFMISDFIHASHHLYMNKEQLKELSKMSGVTIGAHGKTHNPLAKMQISEAREELRISKEMIEDILGKEVNTMSFPHGSFNQELLMIAKELGYKKCGTSVPRLNDGTSDLNVNRHCVYSCESKISLRQKINGQWDWI